MRKVHAEMVTKELTEEQKQRRGKICQDLLAKCAMEDCQFSMTKKVLSVHIKSQNNVANFF
jgi:hypothetical protein